MPTAAKARQHLERIHARVASALRGAEHGATESIQDALAHGRAAIEDMDGDFAVPPRDPAPRREELEALKRHHEQLAALLPHVSNLDDPAWRAAYEAYERSWDELHRVLDGGAEETPGRAPRES